MSKLKLNSEYVFQKKVNDKLISLTVYINYENETYDIMQQNEEGIFCRKNNKEVFTNIAYMQLSIEALKFIHKNLYKIHT
jgi:hypothetical protein